MSILKRVVFTKLMVVNTVNVVLTLLKRKMYLPRIARGQQEECYGRSGQHEDSGRSRGQREELRTAGGAEDSGRVVN